MFYNHGAHCEAFVNQYKNLNLKFNSVSCLKLKFYPIVDSVEWVKKLASLGVGSVQLRLKLKALSEVEEAAREAQNICQFYGAQFFLNDYWQIAMKLNLFGVHLGFEDIQNADLKNIQSKGLRLGLSTHSIFELATAMALNPSYIALGPVFRTSVKKLRFTEQGLKRVAQWRNLIPANIPLVAIGGITLEKSLSVYDHGANSIAVVSDVTQNHFYEKRVLDWLAVNSLGANYSAKS